MFLSRAMNFFWPQSRGGGRSPPRPPPSPPWIRRCTVCLTTWKCVLTSRIHRRRLILLPSMLLDSFNSLFVLLVQKVGPVCLENSKLFCDVYGACICQQCRHRWLHYMTDDPPSTTPLPRRKWMLPHDENLSGTDQQYIPYSTTRPKIEAWKPPPAKP